MVPPFLPSYKNTARSLVWAVSLRKIGSPLLIFIMFPLYTVAIIGQYISVLFSEIKNRPIYIVKNVVNSDETLKEDIYEE